MPYFRIRQGWLLVEGDQGSVTRVELPQVSNLKSISPPSSEGDAGSWLAELALEIERYFDGQPVDLSRWPVDLSQMTPFQRRVLEAARTIPAGQTRSYRQVAEMIGRPRAARAVGQALGANPAPLLVPCHRVVGSGGSLGGFGSGLDWKIRLLELERCSST